MKQFRFAALLLLSLPLCLSVPAAATTYMMMPDRALADQSAAAVEVKVVGVNPAPIDGPPATDYLVEIQRVLKGDFTGSTVVVRVPGGVNPDGIGLKIWGAPRFAEGEGAILFLNPSLDGTYRIVHLMLGAFHKRLVNGETVALRDLSEAHDVAAKSLAGDGMDAVRDADLFADWVADRATGLPNQGKYVLRNAKALLPAVPEKYNLITGDDDVPIRWFRFDSGQSVAWKVGGAGQPGLGLDATIAAFRTALDAWTSDPGTDINYVFAGTTTAANGLTHSDGVNSIIFDDPLRNDPRSAVEGTFSCGSGGVIAMGGPFFYQSTRTFKGQRFHEAIEGDIITNDGTACFFQNNSSAAQEVFAHELGHTLGLGHSSNRDALMSANAHNDGRGARLSDDDHTGIAQLYGNGTPTGGGGGGTGGSASLVTPSRVRGQATSRTSVNLTWRDRSTGETAYVIEVKVNTRKAKFQETSTLGPNATSAVVTGLIPGTSYVFRIRAVAGSQSSGYGSAVVATPH